MELLITLVSIFALTGLVYLVRRFTPLKVCPICAGVSLTWLWMLAATLTGQLPITDYQLLIAILMGSSVAGIAFQLEKKLLAGRSPLLWKTLFIPIGFAAVWGIINQIWPLAAGAVTLCAILAWVFLRPHRSTQMPLRMNTDKVAELEKEMKNCC